MIWLKKALELAREAAAHDEVPVGAVVVRDGALIGSGRNRREELQSPISHAEIHALEAAARALGSWRLEGCELYVTLEPCPMCLAASQQARISRIVYGATDPKGGAISLGYSFNTDERTNHRFSVELQAEPECGEILKAFFSRKRKRPTQ